jgi:hypothetical protein
MYIFRTKAGVFSIVHRKGWWYIIYENDVLGRYWTPQQAAEDLAGGRSDSPSNGVDPERLGISDDIGKWEFINS